MIKLNILALLEKKGKTKYWLYKQLGIAWSTTRRPPLSWSGWRHFVNCWIVHPTIFSLLIGKMKEQADEFSL